MKIDAQFQEFLWSLLICVATVMFVWAMQTEEDDLEGDSFRAMAGKKKAQRGLVFRLLYPFILILGDIIAPLPLGQKRALVKKKLVQAGVPGGLTADQFLATYVIGVVVGGLVGAYIDSELATAPMFMIVIGFVGFLYPGMWLDGTIQKRRRRIFRDLPDLLDILRLAVEAGLDMTSAMKVVLERGQDGPLKFELEEIEREISLGRTRQEAFRSFADRLAMTEINSFVLALIQADQLGASVGPILKVQSEMARTRRWQLAETLVNKMPMKMLGPLVTLIFPSSFIILFTPLLIQWMQAK